MPAPTVDFWSAFLVGTLGLLVLGIGYIAIVFLYQRSRLAHEQETLRLVRDSEEHLRTLYDESRAMQDDLSRLSQAILKVQEDERQRLSRELHDDVGQILTAIAVNLEVIGREIDQQPEPVSRRLLDTQSLTAQAAGVVRRFLHELRPEVLDQLGLIPALRYCTRSFAERTGIAVLLEELPEIETLTAEQKLALYRVVQESLTNAAKHAKAQSIEITFDQKNGTLLMTVADDGCGFDTTNRASRGESEQRIHMGLLGMQERTKLVGGTFDLRSRVGEGTTITIGLPARDPLDLHYEADHDKEPTP